MGMTGYEMIGWHQRLGGHEFEQVLGIGDEQLVVAWHAVVNGIRKSQTRLTELTDKIFIV